MGAIQQTPQRGESPVTPISNVPMVRPDQIPQADVLYDPGVAICLSGGGFRATLFHLGALIRLNELGVLSNVKVFSSVSGGSILNGVLATRWSTLIQDSDGVFTNFGQVVNDVADFCATD